MPDPPSSYPNTLYVFNAANYDISFLNVRYRFVFATFIFRVPLDLRIKPKKSKIMHIKGKEFRIGRP